jgi:formylglycine-generating enzyme required for sulfatase activity
MKTTFSIFIGVIISFACYSQNPNSIDSKPKGMEFVPRGSFSVIEGSTPKTISIDAIWMSNEISNKEFREFFEQIKRTPKDTICRFDFSKMSSGKNLKPIIIKHSHLEIINRLMSESAWKTIRGKENYFTDPKYDNYPVVGVTYEGALYYCIWRTNQENEKLKKLGSPMIMDYRLPTEFEWEYVSTFKLTEKKDNAKNELHQVLQGDKNELGLFNLTGNVSEWTSTSENKQNQIVKGSSWLTAGENKPRLLIAPDKATSSIGFRIVRSNFEKK